MSGKGDKPRPFSVSQEHYASEWDRIFGGNKSIAVGNGEQVTYYIRDQVNDALAGDGDTFEEKVSLSDEMQLHGEKHKPEWK